MSNQEAYEILNNHMHWTLIDSEDIKLKQSLGLAIQLLKKHRCGYCNIIMDKKSKNKCGDYGRVCDNCYENLS